MLKSVASILHRCMSLEVNRHVNRRVTTWLARHAGVAMALAIAIVPSLARSAPPLPVLERTAQVSVTPVVADAGVAREIRISGFWPGCVPVGATVTPGGTLRTLVIRLVLPQTLQPCPAAFLPYAVTATFTPTTRGIDKLLVFDVAADYLAEGLLDTRAADDHRSAFNITGMWYDPQSNGSGLTFVHSRVIDNTVFGTWYVYDASGGPRWYTIQNTAWTSQGRVMQGTLYETTAVANCPIGLSYCPTPLGGAASVGQARVTLTGAGSARVEALTSSGALIFSSNVIRVDI